MVGDLLLSTDLAEYLDDDEGDEHYEGMLPCFSSNLHAGEPSLEEMGLSFYDDH